VPDVIVEQFSECRLGYGPIGLDETMRRAAAFGRGAPIAGDAALRRRVLPRCVLESVTADTAKGASAITVELLDGTEVLDSAILAPGVRRAVFFKPVTPARGPLAVRLTGGTAENAVLLLRSSPD
jgi:hypothetical protein